MRFSNRSYLTLAPKRPGGRVMGELSLGVHHDANVATVFVHDGSARESDFQRRYADYAPLQPLPEYRLAKVAMVRDDGSPALAGSYLVDMLP